MAGPGVDATAFGEVWHFFEQQLGYPLTVLGTDYLSRVSMQKYDVLILPNGNYADIYSDRNLESLKAWVRDGGKLIAMEGASPASWPTKKTSCSKPKPLTPSPSKKTRRPTPTSCCAATATAEREEAEDVVQGSVYRVQLDNTHPLAFGYGRHVFRAGAHPAQLPVSWAKAAGTWASSRKTATRPGSSAAKARKELTDTFVVGTQDMGRGQVVYLGDNPLFRAFWQGGKLLFGNAAVPGRPVKLSIRKKSSAVIQRSSFSEMQNCVSDSGGRWLNGI